MNGGIHNQEEGAYPEQQKPDYLHLFGERLEKLSPLSKERTLAIAERFGLDRIALYPEKFVPAVLYAPPETRTSIS